MTPQQLSKSGSEHGHQTAVFAYCAVARHRGWDVADEWARTGEMPKVEKGEIFGKGDKVPALEWLHAIHNQGHGDKVRGGMAKAEGVRKGVADMFLPWPKHDNRGLILYAGLYIEMKKPTERPKREGSKGGLSDEQIMFGEYVKRVGYGFAVCYSWEHAITTLRSYIEWKG